MHDLVDVHCHHYPARYLEACRRDGSGLQHYYRARDGQLVVLQDGAVALALAEPSPDIAARLSIMDEAGIEIQILSLSAPNVYRFSRRTRLSLTREINDELIEMAAAAPDRFRVLISLPLPDVDDALEELERVGAVESVVGIVLCTTIDRRTLDDPGFEPLFDELARRETPVLVHPTTACCTEGIREYGIALGLDYMAETTNAIARLIYSGRFDRYSGIRWIFGHLGGTTPFVVHRFDTYYPQFGSDQTPQEPASAKLARVHFDTVTTNVAALRCALATFRPDQFLFGTDYPHLPKGVDPILETLMEVADEELVEQIGSRGPRELLGLSPAARGVR